MKRANALGKSVEGQEGGGGLRGKEGKRLEARRLSDTYNASSRFILEAHRRTHELQTHPRCAAITVDSRAKGSGAAKTGAACTCTRGKGTTQSVGTRFYSQCAAEERSSRGRSSHTMNRSACHIGPRRTRGTQTPFAEG